MLGSMQQLFDLAVVGSGPAAYAALIAARSFGGSVVVITGDAEHLIATRHPKIRSAAFERRRSAGLAEELLSPDGSLQIFSSAEMGGLANYWGQQLRPYLMDDPWSSTETLPRWEQYRWACTEVEAALTVAGGALYQSPGRVVEPFEFQEPRLLTGTKSQPNAGLDTISHAVADVIASLNNVTVKRARVSRLAQLSEFVRVTLLDGTDLVARRVLIAAGVPGSAQIVTRSLPQLREARFLDHSPYMFLTVGFQRLLRKYNTLKRHHFNDLSIVGRTEKRTRLFASVYRMSMAPLSLSTAMFGLGPRLRGRYPPAVVDAMRPIQLWTEETVSECRLVVSDQTFSALDPPHREDAGLEDFQDWLMAERVLFRRSRTLPGQGFHFHRLEFSSGQGPSTGVDEILRVAFGGRVICVDGSILRRIGCLPHTLTMMAHSFARARETLVG